MSAWMEEERCPHSHFIRLIKHNRTNYQSEPKEPHVLKRDTSAEKVGDKDALFF